MPTRPLAGRVVVATVCLVPEQPHDVADDPELLQAIGELTLASSRLEFHLAYLVAVARDEDTDWLAATLGKVGEARRSLAELVKLVGADPAARPLVRLRRDADALLDDRSRLVHSVAMWDVSDAVPAPVFWHPRSDTEATITAGQVREHAHDLGAVAARTVEATNGVRELFLRHSTP